MINVEILGMKGRPGPVRGIEFTGRLRWVGFTPGVLLGLDGRLGLKDRVLADVLVFEPQWQDDRGLQLQGDRDYPCKLTATLTSAAVRFVEEERQDGDIPLRLSIRYLYQKLVVGPAAPGSQPNLLPAQVISQTAQAALADVPRSNWLKLLSEMRWDEVEMFELRVLPLRADERLSSALRLLQEAQVALRTCDYKGVIIKCANAFESAARYMAAGNDTARGFQLLLKAVYGEEDAKILAMDAIIDSLRKYGQAVGRHEQYPAVYPSRAEAEFYYACTLALFSFLSRNLPSDSDR